MNRSKNIPFVIANLFCLIGIGYGYWGAFTLSGNHYYDEMDALYPFYMLVISSIVFLILNIYWIIKKLKKS
jgi:hypothetical protein